MELSAPDTNSLCRLRLIVSKNADAHFWSKDGGDNDDDDDHDARVKTAVEYSDGDDGDIRCLSC